MNHLGVEWFFTILALCTVLSLAKMSGATLLNYVEDLTEDLGILQGQLENLRFIFDQGEFKLHIHTGIVSSYFSFEPGRESML